MIGVDTVSVERIEKAIKREAFKTKTFTAGEIAYCDGKPNPAQSYAGIFCAKEAAVKAAKCGFTRGVKPIDIEISHDASGAPELAFHGNAANVFARYKNADVSISHDGGFAVAAVLLEQ